jgi:transcriptional regulator with XRE-family HTH domain
MYGEIWRRYQSELPNFPKLRRPLIGAVIKETRIDKGIRQLDFARQTGLNWSTLKSIENDHQLATTVDNLQRCSRILDLAVDEMILLGRERDPANFFAFKRSAPPEVKGIRKRKKFPQEWHQSMRLRFKDFDVTPISPPIATKKDFFMSRINLPPKRAMEGLVAGQHYPVVGFISEGFNIAVRFRETSIGLTANQAFALDGSSTHDIVNEDEDHAAVIYLMTRFSKDDVIHPGHQPAAKESAAINVAKGIDQIRRYKSDRPNRLISVKHLADLTDSLNHEQIMKLMRIKRGSSVIYWEKIEDLLSGTGVPMEEFLSWCHQRDDGILSVATATTRAVIDYSAYFGVKIYAATPPHTRGEFFCGEISMEGKGPLPKKSWERKDKAMIALYVEEGEIEIRVGRRRTPLTLVKGESAYFDGSLGYLLRNPSDAPAKGFFSSCPALAF